MERQAGIWYPCSGHFTFHLINKVEFTQSFSYYSTLTEVKTTHPKFLCYIFYTAAFCVFNSYSISFQISFGGRCKSPAVWTPKNIQDGELHNNISRLKSVNYRYKSLNFRCLRGPDYACVQIYFFLSFSSTQWSKVLL